MPFISIRKFSSPPPGRCARSSPHHVGADALIGPKAPLCKGSCRRRRLRDCRATNGRPYNHDWQCDRIRRGGHRPPAPHRSGLPPLSQGRWHLRALRANDGEVVKIVTFKPLSRGKPRQLPFHKGSLWAGDQCSPAGPMRASAPTRCGRKSQKRADSTRKGHAASVTLLRREQLRKVVRPYKAFQMEF